MSSATCTSAFANELAAPCSLPAFLALLRLRGPAAIPAKRNKVTINHDLHDFIEQLGHKMDAEYRRIRKTASQDPGTAGDEGEENWAELLWDWLPASYQVVTKGQLLASDGTLSPQMDVMVLKSSYPRSLHYKKKYLIAGVAAVFECKLTMKKAHIQKTLQTGSAIKRMTHASAGTPYRELTARPIVGMLAHSGSWEVSDDRHATIERISNLITRPTQHM